MQRFMARMRRFLLDMHIPDWDELFLSEYDPKYITDLFEKAGIESVMLYCQSHLGLCYWPTKVGTVHGAARNRDLLGEMIELCRRKGMELYGYYSVIYNNQAYLDHPDWRLQSSSDVTGVPFLGGRYGHVCPNHPDYRTFALKQVEEIIGSYQFDGFFFDMTFWPAICICPSCRDRFRSETGKEIPDTVDWFDPDWCSFQRAREQWMTEFAGDLTGTVKNVSPNIPVYHNFAVALFNWSRGINFDIAGHNDFLGGDFYGGPLEQQMISRFMLNLSESKPVEFMTSTCVHLTDHVQLKSFEELEVQAFAALQFGAAFRFIDAIDPIGTIKPPLYEWIGDIYRRMIPYGRYLGGEPVEDVAVYLSDHSKMNFEENGLTIDNPSLRRGTMPHLEAVKGMVRILMEAHIPFGIITRKQLGRLKDYKTVILPNVLRMEEKEAEAFRSYVADGGSLYASRYTSLTLNGGERLSDFSLADLFGCSYSGELEGSLGYILPVQDDGKASIAPQRMVGHPVLPDGSSGFLKVAPGSGSVLATLTLPYGFPREGKVEDQDWASIHSSPPWEQTDVPVIIENSFGSGRCIYSAADIETAGSTAHTNLLLFLLGKLNNESFSFETDVHPAVWTNIAHQPEQKRYIISFLNYQHKLPPVPVKKIAFRVCLPRGLRPTRLVQLPEERETSMKLERDNSIKAEINHLELFGMYSLEYREE